MANSLTAYTPEMWSQEAINILRETIVMPRLVRRDFSRDLAEAGDTVNTRKPGKMTAADVNTTTGVSVMDVSSTNVAVTLNQHKHTTFLIKDREATRSFANLVTEFLDPAMLAIANAVDLALLGLYSDVTSTLTVTSAGDWKKKFSSARTKLNKNKAPTPMRYAVLSDDDEGQVGELDILQKVNESGGSQTLREGIVGRYKGFDVMRSSNVLGVGSPAVRKNLFFHRDAFALVVRPLATATGKTYGAEQRVAQDPDAGIAIRTTMSYDTTLLGTKVTCDLLFGVKTLDEQLAVLLNSSTT